MTEQRKKARISWSTSETDGTTFATPYIINSSVLMGCQHGRDTHCARKKKGLAASTDTVRVRCYVTATLYNLWAPVLLSVGTSRRF